MWEFPPVQHFRPFMNGVLPKDSCLRVIKIDDNLFEILESIQDVVDEDYLDDEASASGAASSAN